MQDPSVDYSCGPDWFQNGLYAPQRLMASIRFATLDLSNRTTEWGLSSRECLDGPPNGDKSRAWEDMYTERECFAHFEQCKWSKHLVATLRLDGRLMSEINLMLDVVV